MLRSDRSTPDSVALAAELRLALSRRQKELPPRWVEPADAPFRLPSEASVSAQQLEQIESELGLTVLAEHWGEVRPRGIVSVPPRASRANQALIDALQRRGAVAATAAVALDGTRVPDDRFPRPRAYLCLGNALGTIPTIGAVRVLRELRSTMYPGDAIFLGVLLSASRGTSAIPCCLADDDAAPHFHALDLLNETFGAGLDPARFTCEARYDTENRRAETHLVARRALEVRIPGGAAIRLRRGESIRTSVCCTYDRPRVSAMLAGVGLSLRAWLVDPNQWLAVALATPAT